MSVRGATIFTKVQDMARHLCPQGILMMSPETVLVLATSSPAMLRKHKVRIDNSLYIGKVY